MTEIPVTCAICGLLGGEVCSADLTPILRFHVACIKCHVCGRSDGLDLSFAIPETGGFIWIHEHCMFTPQEMEDLFKLATKYKRSSEYGREQS